MEWLPRTVSLCRSCFKSLMRFNKKESVPEEICLQGLILVRMTGLEPTQYCYH